MDIIYNITQSLPKHVINMEIRQIFSKKKKKEKKRVQLLNPCALCT